MDVVDSLPPARNRSVTRGDTLSWDVFLKRPEPTSQVPIPVDLTGGKAWATFKRDVSKPDENATLRLSTTLGGVAIVNAASGQVRVTVPANAFLSLPDDPVDLAYDVQGADSAGAVTTGERGTMTVMPDVTRAVG